MKNKIIPFDYHVHSEFSDDSTELMEHVIEHAINIGVKELCFTDHVDYGVKYDHTELQTMTPDQRCKVGKQLNVDYPRYFEKIAMLKAQYARKIILKQGLEFGVQTHTINRFDTLFNQYRLDFVILSCHQVNNLEFWNGEFQKGKTPDEYNARYYQEILACATQFDHYSVLGHLDMIQRYNTSLHPFSKSKEIIAEILKTVISKGKGIEVNTSSFRYGLADLMPARQILSLYHDLGGEIITVGSDAHRATDVGKDINTVIDVLKGLKYRYICSFEQMKPLFHKI